MAKTPMFDPGSSEVRSPLLAGLTEGVSKLSDILNIETTTNTLTLQNVKISDTDKNRIYQASANSRLWLENPAPVIKKNGVVITPENDSFIIDYVGGSISFEKTARLEDDDVVTVEVTYCTNQSKTIKDINTNIKKLNEEFSDFTDFITGEGAPTSVTEGKVGQDYVDTATGYKYHLVSTNGGIYTWEQYQDKLTIDKVPTDSSENPVSSGGVYLELSKKQSTITGNKGQLIGIGDGGAATATVYPSNQTILDNGYFLDPINQRGQEKYTANGYSIDRWMLFLDPSNGSYFSIGEDGLILERMSEKDNQSVQIRQAININDFLGKTITFSVLSKNRSGTCMSFIAFTKNINDSSHIKSIKITDDLVNLTVDIPFDLDVSSFPYLVVGFLVGTQNASKIDIQAVKLELGDHQTLAHQDADGVWVLNDPPPNKALELAKCQRYQEDTGLFYFEIHETGTFQQTIQWRVPKRANANVTVYSMGMEAGKVSLLLPNAGGTWTTTDAESFDISGSTVSSSRIFIRNIIAGSQIAFRVFADSNL